MVPLVVGRKTRRNDPLQGSEAACGVLPGLQEEYSKGIDHVVGLTKPRLVEFVRYFFQESVKGISTMKKLELQTVVRQFTTKKMATDAQEEATPSTTSN